MTVLRYIVCSNIRTGSNLFCRALERTGRLGAPTELFHPAQMQQHGRNWTDLTAFCKDVRRADEAATGAFGLKLHWYQFRDFLAVARRAGMSRSDAAILFGQVPEARLIFLRRRDVEAQAVSAVVANMTGTWERQAGHEEAPARKVPDPGLFALVRVYDWEQFLRRQNDAWRAFFGRHDLTYHEIVFEDLVADFQTGMTDAVRFLQDGRDQPAETFAMPTERANSALTSALLERYRAYPRGVLAGLCLLYRPYRATRQWLGRVVRSYRQRVR